MGVAGQQGGGVLARATAQGHPRAVDGVGDVGARAPGVQAQVGGHLVVAAAAGVQAAARLAHQLGQARFQVHVDVFQRGLQRQRPGLDLAGRLLQPGGDALGVLGRDQPHRRQHAGVRLAAAHVVAQEAAVEPDAGVQRRRGRVHLAGETRAPAAGRRSGRRRRLAHHGQPRSFRGTSLV
jgi:hypothetical protein